MATVIQIHTRDGEVSERHKKSPHKMRLYYTYIYPAFDIKYQLQTQI